MSVFSEKLRQYVNRSEKTVYLLAKKANVNRPMIHKAMKGDSIPSDAFIKQLAEALMLSNGELRELLDLAERARVGEMVYWRRRRADAVLKDVGKERNDMVFHPRTDYVSIVNNHKDQYYVLEGTYELKCCLWEMLEQVSASGDDCEICFTLPGNAKSFFMMIRERFADHGIQIRLKQLVKLEKDHQLKHKLIFLKFSVLIKFLLFSSLTKRTIIKTS